mgnify:CR=1 FL=1
MIKLLIFVILLTHFRIASAQTQQQQLVAMDQRISDLELKSFFDKFNFSGHFLNHYENLYSTEKDTETGESSHSILNPVLMSVGLNIDVKVNSKLSFYSTLGMSKFWNQAGRNSNDIGEGPQYDSMRGSYGINGPEAYFDTAYISYRLSERFTFALGRMTTNNGPPIEQVEGVVRSGTYPRFAYNAIFDGVAGVYDSSSFLPKNHFLKFRIFYTPFIYVDEEKRNERSTESSSSEKIEALQSQSALLAEYTYKNSEWFKNLDIFYMIWNYENFYDEGFQDESNSVIEYSAATSQSLYLGFENLFHSNFSMSYTYYTFKERFTGLEEQSSFNYLVNVNYRFNRESRTFGGVVLGYEYINTDDIFYLEDLNSLYIADFYTRHSNNGNHIYVSKSIDSTQSIRLGYFTYKAGISDWNEEYNDSEVESIYLRWKVFF